MKKSSGADELYQEQMIHGAKIKDNLLTKLDHFSKVANFEHDSMYI